MEESFAPARHSEVGPSVTGFSRLIDEAASDGKDHEPAGSDKWVALAQAMQAPPRQSLDDEPDWEENLFMPAGYTYLAQFTAHDLSFDTAASMALHGRGPNARTPRFDLDCLYGAGPTDQPYMYAEDRATLLLGRTAQGSDDLLRTHPGNGEAPRAIIGDPRNDENAIICQLHIAFIRFHNEVVRQLQAAGRVDEPLRGRAQRSALDLPADPGRGLPAAARARRRESGVRRPALAGSEGSARRTTVRTGSSAGPGMQYRSNSPRRPSASGTRWFATAIA